jgi:hypothetical protein
MYETHSWNWANETFLAEGLDMFRIGPTATGGKMIPSGNLSILKRHWLDGCLEVEPRRVGFALAEGLCDLGGGG